MARPRECCWLANTSSIPFFSSFSFYFSGVLVHACDDPWGRARGLVTDKARQPARAAAAICGRLDPLETGSGPAGLQTPRMWFGWGALRMSGEVRESG